MTFKIIAIFQDGNFINAIPYQEHIENIQKYIKELNTNPALSGKEFQYEVCEIEKSIEEVKKFFNL